MSWRLARPWSGFARNEVQGDLSFELDAMGAVLGHGFHPLKARHRAGQFPTCKLSTVRGAFQCRDKHGPDCRWPMVTARYVMPYLQR